MIVVWEKFERGRNFLQELVAEIRRTNQSCGVFLSWLWQHLHFLLRWFAFDISSCIILLKGSSFICGKNFGLCYRYSKANSRFWLWSLCYRPSWFWPFRWFTWSHPKFWWLSWKCYWTVHQNERYIQILPVIAFVLNLAFGFFSSGMIPRETWIEKFAPVSARTVNGRSSCLKNSSQRTSSLGWSYPCRSNV